MRFRLGPGQSDHVLGVERLALASLRGRQVETDHTLNCPTDPQAGLLGLESSVVLGCLAHQRGRELCSAAESSQGGLHTALSVSVSLSTTNVYKRHPGIPRCCPADTLETDLVWFQGKF